MQLQPLLALAALAATGVNGQWNQAWCDTDRINSIVDVVATEKSCNALTGSTDARLTKGTTFKGDPDALCISNGGEIDGPAWKASCTANGAKESGRGQES
ncbi:hypothetical protein HYALB_00006679 [Hymenoscyphus albidus]|uniref:Cyanovirin-N domain-containing protein n=1 Tax=Hymenoscyphus albidus TaxID=595503 RepID=A0A9N9Q5X7_9HELO|nr:hypothetical protein HYALB_00006679 [Hymenoscyphus albidus]